MNRFFPINLQLFAEEKTEKATPKKRKDARERGQVLRSTELNSTVVLLAAFMGMKLLGPSAVKEMKRFMTLFLSGAVLTQEPLTIEYIGEMAMQAVMSFGLMVTPLMLIILAAGLVIHFVQVGFLFTSKPLGFKLSRINPLEGMKRLFSPRSFTQLFKSILKVVIIGITVYNGFMDSLVGIPGVMEQDLISGVSFMIEGIFNIAFDACLAFAILSVADYLYEWWMHEKDLRMTKQEIKEEFRQMEGDPQIKSRIREKQRQIGMSRMMQQVPEADVVIANPTHFAVALKYEETSDKAPVVIAKGQDYIALRIRKVAEENHIRVVENKPLARSLYQSAEIGKEIPVEMYKAVAEILAYVYKMKKNL
jgi:flagellar biosynthetic protein FlhB